MRPKKIVQYEQEIPITLSLREREIILNHTSAGPHLTDKLKSASPDGNKVIMKYTIDDIDNLLGFISTEVNHTDDEKLMKEMDRLFERIARIQELYIEEEEL